MSPLSPRRPCGGWACGGLTVRPDGPVAGRAGRAWQCAHHARGGDRLLDPLHRLPPDPVCVAARCRDGAAATRRPARGEYSDSIVSGFIKTEIPYTQCHGCDENGKYCARAGLEPTSPTLRVSVLPVHHHVASLMSPLYPCPPVYATPCLRGQCRPLHTVCGMWYAACLLAPNLWSTVIVPVFSTAFVFAFTLMLITTWINPLAAFAFVFVFACTFAFASRNMEAPQCVYMLLVNFSSYSHIPHIWNLWFHICDFGVSICLNANAASGSIHGPIGANANVNAIEVTKNFDVLSQIGLWTLLVTWWRHCVSAPSFKSIYLLLLP